MPASTLPPTPGAWTSDCSRAATSEESDDNSVQIKKVNSPASGGYDESEQYITNDVDHFSESNRAKFRLKKLNFLIY